MLKAMRDGAKSPVMKVFLVFLAGGFALWGVGDVTTGLIGGSDKAVSAGDESVSPIEVASQFDRTRRNYLPNATVGEALQAGLLNELAGSISRDVVFRAEANSLGLTVTRDMQRTAVANEPAFQDADGNFSEGRFLQALANAGLNEAIYLKEVDTVLRREQLVAALSIGVKQPSAFAEAMSAYELEKRTAKMISVTVDVDAVNAPSAAVLSSWYDGVKGSYDAPALRSARVGSLTPAMLMADVQIDEDDIRSAFDLRLDEFTTPETRNIRQMVFDDVADAQTALDRIAAGEAFNDVAADMLNWTADDVTLGTLSRSALDDALGAAAFAAEQGKAVGPVESLFGQHVLLIDEINAGSSASFEDVRAAIETTLKSETAIDIIYDRVSELEDKIASGATLYEAMNAVGGTITQLSDIDRNGLDIDGQPVAGDGADLAQNSLVRDLIWNGDIGELSVIQEGADDMFFLADVTNETEARGRSLGEVESRASMDWRRSEAIKAAREAATALAADAGKFADVSESESFRRNGIGLDHEAARLISAAIFAKPVGETDIAETGTEAIALMTASVTAADAEEQAKTAELVGNVINNSVRQDIVNILALQLSQKHDLTLNLGPVQQLLIGTSN